MDCKSCSQGLAVCQCWIFCASVRLFPHLFSTDAFSKVFPRFFLHSASRSSPPPMLSASSVTCSSSRTSSPHMLFASYVHDFSSIALLPLFPTSFPTAASVSSRSSSPPMVFASYFHDVSSRALPVSLLHRCFSQAISRIVLHSASRTSSPPMLSASYFHDSSFIALPVPLLHRCFPQAISRVPLPVPLLQRCVSQAISTIFPPCTFPALFPTHFAAMDRSLRYRGAPGSETKREPKHRRCFWEKMGSKKIKIEKWHLRKMTGPQKF